MKVPDHIRQHLEQWGPTMKAAFFDARDKFLQQQGLTGGSWQTVTQHIATDCSGLEAPIAALDSLGLPYRHIWSCDSSRAAQKWIAKNYKPEQFYDNCLGRDLPPSCAESVTGYLAGFPCQPFSKLNNARTYFKDSRCKVFNAVLEVANKCLPLWCVLENVQDILRFQKQLQSRFKKFLHNQYIVMCIPLCPSTLFQEPVERPRCWFILIRQDVILSHDMEQVRCLVERLLNSLAPKLQSKTHLAHRLLPAVSSSAGHSRQDRPSNKVAKWVSKHAALRHKLGLGQPSHKNKLIPTCTARENDLLSLVMQSRPRSTGTLVVDVSQSAGRTPIRLNICPTIASSSRVVVCSESGQNRVLTSLDKLALHWFPIHKLEVPDGVSDHEMATLTGNTQHVGTCAVALLIAMSLVNWSKQASTREELAKLSNLHQPLRPFHVWFWRNGELKAAKKSIHRQTVQKRGSLDHNNNAASLPAKRPAARLSGSLQKIPSSKQSHSGRAGVCKMAQRVSSKGSASCVHPPVHKGSVAKSSMFAQLFT